MEDQGTPKTGRPTIFTAELADRICAELAIGKSARSVLSGDGMPSMQTFWRWLREDEAFREQYTRAKKEGAEMMAEDILDIADNGTNDWVEEEVRKGKVKIVFNKEAFERSRLRVDTRKFLMSKLLPRKYGTNIDLTSDGKRLPVPILGGLSMANPAQLAAVQQPATPQKQSTPQSDTPSEASTPQRTTQSRPRGR